MCVIVCRLRLVRVLMRVKVKAGGRLGTFPRRLGAPHADHLSWFSAPKMLF